MAAAYKLAVIIKNPSNEDEFILVKQAPPPKFDDEDYDSYVDSDLWDLPSTQLLLQQQQSRSQFFIQDQDLCSDKIDLTTLDLDLALNQVYNIPKWRTHICFDLLCVFLLLHSHDVLEEETKMMKLILCCVVCKEFNALSWIWFYALGEKVMWFVFHMF